MPVPFLSASTGDGASWGNPPSATILSAIAARDGAKITWMKPDTDETNNYIDVVMQRPEHYVYSVFVTLRTRLIPNGYEGYNDSAEVLIVDAGGERVQSRLVLYDGAWAEDSTTILSASRFTHDVSGNWTIRFRAYANNAGTAVDLEYLSAEYRYGSVLLPTAEAAYQEDLWLDHNNSDLPADINAAISDVIVQDHNAGTWIALIGDSPSTFARLQVRFPNPLANLPEYGFRFGITLSVQIVEPINVTIELRDYGGVLIATQTFQITAGASGAGWVTYLLQTLTLIFEDEVDLSQLRADFVFDSEEQLTPEPEGDSKLRISAINLIRVGDAPDGPGPGGQSAAGAAMLLMMCGP